MHVDNKGRRDGLWRERKCIDPKAGDADLWIKQFCEELQLLTSKEILVEVEHVKAHRTEDDKKYMTHFEKFVTDGNEKAGVSWQRQERCWMKDSWRRPEQKRFSRNEKRCTQPCSTQPAFHCMVEEWKDFEEVKPKPKEN